MPQNRMNFKVLMLFLSIKMSANSVRVDFKKQMLFNYNKFAR